MQKITIIKIKSIYFIFIFNIIRSNIDIIGPVNQADGIGQISIGIFETIKDQIKTFVFPNDYRLDNISDDLSNNILKNLKNNYNYQTLFFTNLASTYFNLENVIKNYSLKIACSLFEADRLPDLWVKALNNFDIVVVHSAWLIDAYQQSGINVPIYNINIPLATEDLVRKSLDKSSNKFIFGMTAGPWRRKNHIKLIEAFKKIFKNNDNVLLKIHIRKFYELLSLDPKCFYDWRYVIDYCHEIKNLIGDAQNIEIVGDVLDRHDYIEFISSLDCLVLPSAGEGFSISPRESLALGIPIIISENSSHLDLASYPGVLFIPSKDKINAVVDFDGLNFGKQYDIGIEDISKSLEEMLLKYSYYKDGALLNSCESLKLSYSSLVSDYLTLIAPKKIILSNQNKIDSVNMILYTNNKDLYKKYINNFN